MARFTKAPLGNKDLLHKMRERGLIIEDEPAAYDALERIGYYRLSGYFLHFQTENKYSKNPHNFNKNTTFSDVLRLYSLDTDLRTVISAALERLEIALRASICEYMCRTYGAHWYTSPKSFEVGKSQAILEEAAKHVDFDLAKNRAYKQDPEANKKKSRQLFVDHYYATYHDPKMPPAWMLREQATFGFWARTYEALKTGDQKQIAQRWTHPDGSRIDPDLFASWLWSTSILRNRCSHHTRITTQRFPFSPKLPDKNSSRALFNSKTDDLRTLVSIIFILTHAVDAQYDFRSRIRKILEKYPTINIDAATGFSLEGQQRWEETSFWQWTPPAK